MQTVIYTDIATDGMLTGPNLPALEELARAVPAVGLIASGGIASLAHMESLRNVKGRIEGVIIGKAIYEGKLTVAEAIKAATPASS